MAATTTISSILRNFDGDPNIVSIVTSADLTTITTAGYLTDEDANIQLINNGEFQWSTTDIVLIFYAPGDVGWFIHDATNATFISNPVNGGISTTLPSGDIIVGSGTNVATARAMTGDVAISNTGVTTIQAGAVTASKLASNTVDYASLALDVMQSATVPLSAAQIAGMYGTPVQLIAAPGSGKLILIEDITWDIAFVSAQYTAGGAIAAQYGNTAHGAGPLASATLAAATLNAVAASAYISEAGAGGVLNVPVSVLNTAVYISNDTAAFATGDSTATLYVRYRVITPA